MMVDVIVVCEEPSEATFVRDIFLDILLAHETYLYPRLISTSPTAKGGASIGTGASATCVTPLENVKIPT